MLKRQQKLWKLVKRFKKEKKNLDNRCDKCQIQAKKGKKKMVYKRCSPSGQYEIILDLPNPSKPSNHLPPHFNTPCTITFHPCAPP